MNWNILLITMIAIPLGIVAVARAKTTGMKDFLVVHQTHTFIMQNREVIDQALFFINNGFFKRESDHNPQADYALNYIPSPSWWPH